MRIGLAQINTSTGNLTGNARKIDRFLTDAEAKGAELTLFPELALVGYPPKDLLDQEGFVGRSREILDRLAGEHARRKFIVGCVDEAARTVGKGRFNAAAYIADGKVKYVQHKRLLPTYDVFDETRYFDAGKTSEVITIGGSRFGLTVCEDIWNDPEVLGNRLYEARPVADIKKKGGEMIINISASPYHQGKEEIRKQLIRNIAGEAKLPIFYVNLVGGNDELLFDGGSFVSDTSGKVVARANVFAEDLIVVDTKTLSGEFREWPEGEESWITSALVMGLRDYVGKCGFEKVVIGLSGGIDSSLVALLAVEALGAERVAGISMPSRFSSQGTRADAETMARKLGITFYTVPIDPVVRTLEESLSDIFTGRARDVTEENIQARVRGTLLMAVSNKFGHLVLSTGNKSELAVGYCTQYGDMVGGLAVISDLPKAGVYQVARHLNQKWKAIPESVFDRPPTAELRADQKDEDSLPSYSVLDPILKRYIEERQSAESIVQAGFDAEVVERVLGLVDRNEFKRRQAAPGLRLSAKAFGVGRRMPVARGSV